MNRSCLTLNTNNSGDWHSPKYRTISMSTNDNEKNEKTHLTRSSSTLTINVDRKPIELDIQLSKSARSPSTMRTCFDLSNCNNLNQRQYSSHVTTPKFQDNRMINSFSFKSNKLSDNSPLSNSGTMTNVFHSDDHSRRAPTIVKKYSSISRNPSRPSSRASSLRPHAINIDLQNSPINIIETPKSSISTPYEPDRNILKRSHQLTLNTKLGEKWSGNHQENLPTSQSFCSQKKTMLSPIRSPERNAHIVASSANRAMRRPRAQRYHTIK
ncbi:hypothetical protein SNEBB_007725 [Seison nebaliae]|nr:hypothetical protein SNEBB_007725 [Seison nebaliae]